MTDTMNSQVRVSGPLLDPVERLSDPNDLGTDYLVHRQNASAADSITAARNRVAARTAAPAGASPAAGEPRPDPQPGEPAPAIASRVPPAAPRSALATAGAVVKDVAVGLREAPGQIIGGVSDAIHRTFMAADGLAQWLNNNVADLRYGDETSLNPLRAAAGAEDPADRGVPGAATSVTGGLVREASRFLTLFLPANRLMTAAGAGVATSGLAAGGVSDFLGADPNGERLADLWKKAELPDNVLTDWLSQHGNEGDGEVEKRFKNALEGAGFGALTEGVMLAARTVRGALQARGATSSAVDALAAAKAEYGSLGERDFLLLGDPNKPLLSIERPAPADPQGKINAAAAATETGVPTDVAARGVAGSAADAASRGGVLELPPEQRGSVTSAIVDMWRRFRSKGPGPQENVSIDIGPVSEEGAARIAAAAREAGVELDVSGFTHTVDAFATRHASARHADAKIEQSRGQLPLTEKDWSSIPEILAAPDRVSVLAKTEQGRDAIGYWKQVNGHVLYVEEVRTGKQTLAATTMYKTKGKLEEVAPGRSDAAAGPQDLTSGTLPSAAGKVTEPRIEINFARISAPEDVKQVIDDMAQAFAGDIDVARRGVQSNDETKVLADQLGLSVNDLLARRRGEPLNAEQSLAARRLLNSSAQKLLEVAQKAASPSASAVDQFQFRKMMAMHYAIQAEVVAARTETARALQAWSIPAGVGDIERSRAVTDMLANMGGPDLSAAMAKRLAALAAQGAPPEAINAAVRKGWGAASADAVREAYVMGLLWSPTTHIVNSSSNLLVALQQIQERALASGFSSAAGRAAGEGVADGEAVAMTWGLVSGLKDAFRLGGQALRTGTKVDMAGKIDLPREPAISAGAFNLDTAGAVGRTVDFIGATTRVPGHLLAAQDAFFASIGYRMELHAQAWRTATSEGLSGPDAGRRMAEILANPPENLRIAAADAAAYSTFNNEPGGFAQTMMKLRNHRGDDGTGLANLNPLFIVLPFVRTPANVLSYSFERTPIAPLVGRWRADIAAGGARADLAMARMSTGTSIMLLAADLAANGHVTGAGPKDPGEREALVRQGWQPYSIKVGDAYYGYNRLDPFGMLAGFASTMQEVASRGDIDPDDVDEWQEVVAGAINAVSQTVVDKTFFTGVAQLFEVLGDPTRYTSDYINGLVGSFVPFTSALGFAERMNDPTASEVNGPWDAVMAKIPGLSARLTPKRSLWGDEIRPQGVYGAAFDATSPVKVSEARNSPIDAEMTRLNLDVRRIPKKTHLDGADVSLRDFPEAYDELVRLAGNELKHPVWGLGARDYLNAVVSGGHEMSAVYNMGSDGKDGGKAEFIRRTIVDYRQLAARQLLDDPRFADLRSLVDDRKTQRQERRMPVMQ